MDIIVFHNDRTREYFFSNKKEQVEFGFRQRTYEVNKDLVSKLKIVRNSELRGLTEVPNPITEFAPDFRVVTIRDEGLFVVKRYGELLTPNIDGTKTVHGGFLGQGVRIWANIKAVKQFALDNNAKVHKLIISTEEV